MTDEILSVEGLIEHHFKRLNKGAPTPKQRELLRAYVWTVASILQEGGGMTKTVAGNEQEMADDFAIMESDLTTSGKKFHRIYMIRWLFSRRLHKETGTREDFARARNRSVLAKQLNLIKVRLDISSRLKIDPIWINNVRSYAFDEKPFPPQEVWPAQYYVTLFQTAIAFMQDKGLTTRVLAATPEEIDLDFDVWTSDLTELGDVFYTILRTYWFTYDYPKEENEAAYKRARDIKKLEKLYDRALKKVEKEAKKKEQDKDMVKPKPFIIPKRPASTREPKEEWVKYDDATWHMEGNFPDDDAFPDDMEGNPASTHIGMFLAFLLLSGFASEEIFEDWEVELEQLRTKEITPGVLLTYMDFTFNSEQLTDEGNAFTQDYYKQQYFDDYDKILCQGLPTQYHVYDTWDNYMKLKPVLEKRLSDWEAGQ